MPANPRYAKAWAAYRANNPHVQASYNEQHGYLPPEQYRHLIDSPSDPDREQPAAATGDATSFEGLVAIAAKALQDAAHDCPGDCGLDEHECNDQHPIRATVLHFDQVADVEGSIDAIVRVVLQAVLQAGDVEGRRTCPTHGYLALRFDPSTCTCPPGTNTDGTDAEAATTLGGPTCDTCGKVQSGRPRIHQEA
jgi:hypothetical protein